MGLSSINWNHWTRLGRPKKTCQSIDKFFHVISNNGPFNCYAKKVPDHLNYHYSHTIWVGNSPPPVHLNDEALWMIIIGAIAGVVALVSLIVFLRTLFTEPSLHDGSCKHIGWIFIIPFLLTLILYLLISIPIPSPGSWKLEENCRITNQISNRGGIKYYQMTYGDDQIATFCTRSSSNWMDLQYRDQHESIRHSGLVWYNNLPPISTCTKLEERLHNTYINMLRNPQQCYVAKGKNNVMIASDGYAKNHIEYLNKVFYTLLTIFAICIVIPYLFACKAHKCRIPHIKCSIQFNHTPQTKEGSMVGV